MPLDRRAVELVKGLDAASLRRLVIVARARLRALEGDDRFGDEPGEPAVRYRQRTVRCGKPGCTRCPHGPYVYAYWREDGRARSRYVGRADAAPLDGTGP